MSATSEKRLELELIRALAIAGVVFIHAASVVANNIEVVNRTGWFIVTLMDALVRWSVPVFIMVSGSLLLEKSEPHLPFVKKRLGRVGLPLLIWLPLYWLALAVFSPPLPPLDELFRIVVFKQPYLHFYFLIVMVQLTLLTPWLRSLTRSLTRRSLALLIALLLYLGFAYQPYTHNIFFLFIPYLGYYLYGHFAKNVRLSRQQKLWALGLMVLTALTMTWLQLAVRLRWVELRGVENATQVVAYLSPLVILLSLVAFPLLNDNAILRRVTRLVPAKLIKSVGECSFGIYLIHPILQLAQGKWIPDLFAIQTSHPISVTLAMTVGLFLVSWALVWLIRQLPSLRSLV